ncbi:hypothetical protein [Kitasatospora sp. NPDC057500]|uniref:hypothetical protein n=1 Tax=Kitasatospora sp. NPDC057500 TaxID=3346151 RepID=UPI00367BE457
MTCAGEVGGAKPTYRPGAELAGVAEISPVGGLVREAVLRVRGRLRGLESGVVGIVVVVEQPEDPERLAVHAADSDPDVPGNPTAVTVFGLGTAEMAVDPWRPTAPGRAVDPEGGAPVDGEQSLDGGQQHAGGLTQGGACLSGPAPLGGVLLLGGQQGQRLAAELVVGRQQRGHGFGEMAPVGGVLVVL